MTGGEIIALGLCVICIVAAIYGLDWVQRNHTEALGLDEPWGDVCELPGEMRPPVNIFKRGEGPEGTGGRVTRVRTRHSHHDGTGL
jgi:hypothetical protein